MSVICVEHLSGVQQHNAAANTGKLVLDLEPVHGGALWDEHNDAQDMYREWVERS